jgi:hypothetical protein
LVFRRLVEAKGNNTMTVNTQIQREALKQRLAAHREQARPPAPPVGAQPGEPEPSAASPAPPDAPAPGRAPSAPKPQLTYACGHKEAVASVQGRKCPGCQRADQDVKAKKKREAKRAALPRGRLPDGAVFVFRYAADGLTWSGTLTAAVGGQPREFAGAGTSVEFLQRQLGRACWQAMAEAGEVVPTAGEAPKPEGRA